MNHPPFFQDPYAPVQPDQYEREFSDLLKIYVKLQHARPSFRILEIGVREGGSLYQWMKNAAAGSFILAIDLPMGKWGSPNSLKPDDGEQWAHEFGQQLIYLRQDSHDQHTLFMATSLQPYDFIFIDGDHTEEGVRSDYMEYGKLVRPGGIIAIHDIVRDKTDKNIRVWKLWREIKPTIRHKELRSMPYQKTRGIGVVYA